MCAGLVAATWLEFEFFPGHTYLEGGTQIYLPILERLDSPGFLSRDLVATHPNVSYTIYDEVTLFLHDTTGLDFRSVLLIQQLLFRAAALFGVFLLARAARLGALVAFIVAVLVNLGGALTGPDVRVIEYEPVPHGFAFELVLLAMGLLADAKPLLAGLAGGMALVYHAPSAAPFWCIVLLATIFDRQLRPMLRPAITILIIFALLLANLAQLQPGVVEPQVFFSKISTEWARLQQFRVPSVWISVWGSRDLWHYLALWVIGIWAVARIWFSLNRQMRWLFVLLPIAGILSVPFSDLTLEHLRWALIPQVQPMRTLAFTVVIASLSCGIAGVKAASYSRRREAWFWFVFLFAIPIDTQIFELLRVSDVTSPPRLGLCFGLAALFVITLRQMRNARRRGLVLLVPAAAIFTIPTLGSVHNYPKIREEPIRELALWTEANTWGSSMFLFPDAGRELYPGVFRAGSRRALWVDWESGVQMKYFESFAIEWWNRWRGSMEKPFSAKRLPSMLSLPIDYYVLKRENILPNVKPVFENREFAVYDARDLRSVF